MLDEEVLFPKGSDASFVEKLNNSFSRNPIYKQAASKDVPLSFAVQHYAGQVCGEEGVRQGERGKTAGRY